MMISEYSLVKSLIDVPDKCIKKEDIGTIIHRYTEPREGYEVEFLDSDGCTKDVLTYERYELEPAENQGGPRPQADTSPQRP